MSKKKALKFRLKKDETLIKKGGMDYAPSGGFSHSIMGNAYLTSTRLHYEADERYAKTFVAFDLPLSQIKEITKVGIPVLTRSILIVTEEDSYRFNVFPIGGWLKKLRAAKKSYEEKRANENTHSHTVIER